MTHLGTLGTTNAAAEVVTFDYFGATLHANPQLGELDYVEFLDKAGAMDVDNAGSLVVVKDFARMCIAPEDFDTFWTTARSNRQGVVDVFAVLTAIVEALTDRPTGLPSDSAAGHTNTDTSSTDDDSLRAVKLLTGRPDLQLLVMRRTG